MFVTIHSTASVLISQYAPNPLWAFLIGLASHYIIDAIPHGDDNITIKNIGFAKYIKIVLIDNFILIVNLSLLLILKPGLDMSIILLAALIGAVLPDWLSGILQLEKMRPSRFKWTKKILQPLHNFHLFCHNKIIPFSITVQQGLIVQAIFLIFLWWLI